jgi:hypothetical protein
MIDRRTMYVLALALAIGYWIGGGSAPAPSPEHDRPILRLIAKAAKAFLWVSLVADKPPANAGHGQLYVKAQTIGEDGHPVIDHARGW